MSNKNNNAYIPRHAHKKRKKNNLPFIISSLFFLSIIGYCCYEIVMWQKDNVYIDNLNDFIQEEVEIKKNDDQGEIINPEPNKDSDYWYYISLPLYEVDFTSLLEKNSDTKAFIHMQNTNINYPVVQASDNDYYLNHAFDKSKNDAGWVFLDYRNNLNDMNDNTIIYGHGRLNKTVFGSLKDSLTAKWQQDKDNYTIWLSTPNNNMLYQIFSIYTIKAESYYIKTRFASDESKQEWLDTMKKRNIAPIDTPVDVSDKILTLSTCLNNNGDRIVVQAKLIKIQTR